MSDEILDAIIAEIRENQKLRKASDEYEYEYRHALEAEVYDDVCQIIESYKSDSKPAE